MGTRRKFLVCRSRRATSHERVQHAQENGTYDAFVQRHMRAMMTETPPSDPTTDRNAAHRGQRFAVHRATWWSSSVRCAQSIPSSMTCVLEVGRRYQPVWESTQFTMWTDNYFGPDGDPNQNDRVLTGSFANWQP